MRARVQGWVLRRRKGEGGLGLRVLLWLAVVMWLGKRGEGMIKTS